jgi:hypothetical protein
MSMKVIARTVALLVLTLAATFAGHRTANAGTDVTCFRILHAAPETAAIDVYVSRTRVAAGLTYTQSSTTRYCLPTPQAFVRAFPAGADPNTAGPLVSDTVALEITKRFLIAITGYAQSLEVVALEDPGPPAAGYVALRLVNVAPNVPAVDLTRTDGTRMITNVIFPSSQIGEFPAGSYDLQIRQTGTENVLANLGTLTFAAGQRQSIYVFAQPGPPAAAAAAGSVPTITTKVERDR